MKKVINTSNTYNRMNETPWNKPINRPVEEFIAFVFVWMFDSLRIIKSNWIDWGYLMAP